MTICPECGDDKERISTHWAGSACGYPDISKAQRAILDGLFLSGAAVAGNGNNRHLTIGTTSEALAEWTADQLDWLHHGTRVDRGGANRKDIYRVRTPAHPACNRYERWGDGDTRAPPDDFDLDPLAGRVWWAYAGGLEWPGEWDGQRTATISAQEDARAEWVCRVLATAGIDATRTGERVQWHGQQVRDWLDWIGDSVPGAVHKWASSQIVYRTLRERPATASDYGADLARKALQIARKRTNAELTPEQFDKRVDVVDAAEVAELLGGGSFEDACRVAGVEMDAQKTTSSDSETSETEGEHHLEGSIQYLKWTPQRMGAAVRGWAADKDEFTYTEYKTDAVGNPSLPHPAQLRRRFGSYHEALSEIVGDGYTTGRRRNYWNKENVLNALKEWCERTEKHTTTEYREASRGNPDLPDLDLIYQHYGSWTDAVELATSE